MPPQEAPRQNRGGSPLSETCNLSLRDQFARNLRSNLLRASQTAAQTSPPQRFLCPSRPAIVPTRREFDKEN